MEALKKTGVAAMIMVVCIVLAVLLGDMRASTYKQAQDRGVTVETENRDGIGGLIYDWSTYGTIQKRIEQGTSIAINDDDDIDEDHHIGFGKIILIIVLIAIVSGAFKKK